MKKHDNYFKRTFEHIHRVHINAVTLVTKYRGALDLTMEECRDFCYEVLNHDRSKFSIMQFDAYVELSHYYSQKRLGVNYEYPPGVKEQVDFAVENHYQRENHHPEMFRGTTWLWTKLQAFEAVCDLQAMAQEFNEGTCRKYFETVWVPKSSKFFANDNWNQVYDWMNQAIVCFEKEQDEKL